MEQGKLKYWERTYILLTDIRKEDHIPNRPHPIE